MEFDEDEALTWRGEDLARVRDCVVPDVLENTELAHLALAMCRSRTPLALVTAADEPIGARILCVNEAFARRTGFTAREVLGHSALLLAGARPDPRYLEVLRARRTERHGLPQARTTKFRRDGTRYEACVRVIGARDGAGRLTHRLVLEEDVSRYGQLPFAG